jgi:chromosome segregation ATPase
MINQGNNDKGDIHIQIQKFLNGQTPEQAGLSPRQEEIARRLDALADEQGCLNQAIAELAEKTSKDIAHLHTINSQLMHRIGALEQQLKADRSTVGAVADELPAKRAGVRVWVMRVLGMRVIE